MKNTPVFRTHDNKLSKRVYTITIIVLNKTIWYPVLFWADLMW